MHNELHACYLSKTAALFINLVSAKNVAPAQLSHPSAINIGNLLHPYVRMNTPYYFPHSSVTWFSRANDDQLHIHALGTEHTAAHSTNLALQADTSGCNLAGEVGQGPLWGQGSRVKRVHLSFLSSCR